MGFKVVMPQDGSGNVYLVPPEGMQGTYASLGWHTDSTTRKNRRYSQANNSNNNSSSNKHAS